MAVNYARLQHSLLLLIMKLRFRNWHEKNVKSLHKSGQCLRASTLPAYFKHNSLPPLCAATEGCASTSRQLQVNMDVSLPAPGR